MSKEVSVEEITDLIRISLKDSMVKHFGERPVTPEDKEIIKKKLLEMVEDLHNSGTIVLVPNKAPEA